MKCNPPSKQSKCNPVKVGGLSSSPILSNPLMPVHVSVGDISGNSCSKCSP
jgi:hypothetical protein